MTKLVKLKSSIYLFIIFLASVAYAAAITEIAKTPSDLTIPLIFNGVLPTVVLGWAGKKYLNNIEMTYRELIEAKNDHADRIGRIETTHEIRGCDQPDRRSKPRTAVEDKP